MKRARLAAIGAAVLAAAGLTGGLAATVGSGGPPAAPSAARSGSAATSPYDSPADYAYYESMMGGYAAGAPGMPGMMGGSPGSGPSGWTPGRPGYRWMTGGAAAPAWMRGSALPGFMMGGTADPGRAMGRFWADAPGPRTTAARAARLGEAAPAGAAVQSGARRIVFTTRDVHLVVVASPAMPAEDFRIAGLVDPTVVVPAGAHVTVQLINADTDMAHGLVVAAPGTAAAPMPMMSAAPAFPGAALWFLGEATRAGLHTGSLAFTATDPGSYQYLCPVPGHAREGMAGTFQVAP